MNSTETKVWMIRNNITQARISKDLGVSKTLVWLTITGRGRNRRVLQWLTNHGCPKELLVKQVNR